MPKLTLYFVVTCVLAGMLPCSVAAERPNVLMIMVDDLGFSDLGCYGGEIETPNLDRLANGGLRFSQFYNTAKCHSSRVSLLTGQYCIAAGDVALSHAVTTAETLGAAGYFTAMTGKWHLKQQPTNFGFQRYFGHLSGACNYFLGDKTFRLNGQPWQVPESDFYTTTANVDFAIKFLNEARGTGKPWHLYIAFNAPHAPLQALPQDYAKYKGRYREGWDIVRERRIAKQQRLGLLPEGTQPSPRPEHVPAWDSLTDARRRFEEKRMTALAAMIDRVDQEVGRLVRDLQQTGELDNTLIWFVSDNGACPYDRRSTHVDAEPTDGTVSWSDSTGWAWARNSPFRYYKQNQYEGGIGTPAIIHWPAGITASTGSIVRQPAHLIDIQPTFADVTDSPIPPQFANRDLRPVSGQSLRPLFSGNRLVRREPLHFLFSKDRALRDGDWKAVSFRSEAWELYNLADDRTERNDVAEDHPDRLQEMVRRWTQMTQDVLHAPASAYRPVVEARLPHTHREWTDFSRQPGQNARGNVRGRGGLNDNTIRARKKTTLEIEGDTMQLTFTGEDPGLAFDRLPRSIGTGPYQLRFRLASKAVGDGEIYFTTDPKTSLPKGHRIPFPVNRDGEMHDYAIVLDTHESISKLRLDVSEGQGTATIRDLRLADEAGTTVARWPPRRGRGSQKP